MCKYTIIFYRCGHWRMSPDPEDVMLCPVAISRCGLRPGVDTPPARCYFTPSERKDLFSDNIIGHTFSLEVCGNTECQLVPEETWKEEDERNEYGPNEVRIIEDLCEKVCRTFHNMSDTIGHLRTIGVTPSTFERIRLDYHGEFLIDLIEVSEEEIDDITEQWFAPFNDWVGRIGQLVDAHAPRTFWNAAIDALGYFLDEANRQIRQFNLLAQEEAKEEQMERRRKKNFTPWASSYYDEQEIPEHWRPSPLSPRRQPMSRNWNRRVSFDSPFLSQTDMGYWNHGNGMEHTVTTPPDTQSRYECSPDYMHGERSSSRPLSSAGSENQPTQPLSPTQGISNITTTSNSNNGVTTTQTTNLNVSPNIQMPINITVTIDSVPGEQTVNNYITVKPNINMPMHLNGSIREWTTENHYTGIGSKNPEVSHNEHEAGTVLTPSPDSENLLKRRRADSCDSDLPVPSTENEENHCTGCVCSFRAKRQRSSSFDESSRPSTPTERDLKARMLKLSEYQNPTIIGRKGSFQIPNIFPSLFLASLGRNDTRLKGGPSVKIATDEHFDFDHPDESIDEGCHFHQLQTLSSNLTIQLTLNFFAI